MATTGGFTHALNDGEVNVVFSYPAGYPSQAELHHIEFQSIDVTSIINPEDIEYVCEKIPEKAREWEQDLKADAAEWRRKEAIEERTSC